MSKRTHTITLSDPVAGWESKVDLAALPQPQLQALKTAVMKEEHNRAIDNAERQQTQESFEPEPDFDETTPTPS